MARVLHDTLTELGYEKLLEQTVSALPDAKDRLAYVANLTEQAACRVLNATDIANPLVEQIESSSKALGSRWDKVFANQVSPEEFKRLAEETRAFLNKDLPQKTGATHAQLTEIMMAQDFQDLTGQVIKKIVNLAQTLEAGLMGVLVEVVPETKRTEEVTSLMNGPVVNSEGRTDVVVNQEQVDDLLDSLGF
jgi:chemotaxis protein CheZ